MLTDPVVAIPIGDTVVQFPWGESHLLGTAAFWTGQAAQWAPPSFSIGLNLEEELAVCMLGGHGQPAEVGIAAFRAVARAGLLEGRADRLALQEVLCCPLTLANGRLVKYRFPNQRARLLAAALEGLREIEPSQSGRMLRDRLVSLPGVGPKTASWIARNHLGADDIAIIDIHVRRAGVAAGFFLPAWRLPKDYPLFEQAFLEVARIGGVSAAILDACVWGTLHHLGPAAHLILCSAAAPGRQWF